MKILQKKVRHLVLLWNSPLLFITYLPIAKSVKEVQVCLSSWSTNPGRCYIKYLLHLIEDDLKVLGRKIPSTKWQILYSWKKNPVDTWITALASVRTIWCSKRFLVKVPSTSHLILKYFFLKLHLAIFSESYLVLEVLFFQSALGSLKSSQYPHYLML